MINRFLISLIFMLPISVCAEIAVTFTSPNQQVMLLELYTSEGCSSCPPADRWLSSLKDNPQLWKEIIPVAFHVDYWNDLGWKDEFSRAEYSQRQRNYARFKNLKTVYTPGFLQNGREWRTWFRSRTFNSSLGDKVGRLEVSIKNGAVTASFRPEKEMGSPLTLNVAWLGFDLVTEILAGENEGKTLKHDFVSYRTNEIKGVVEGDTHHWQFNTNAAINNLPGKRGAAFWVTSAKNPTPIQATGGRF